MRTDDTFTIRPARAQDLPAVFDLLKRSGLPEAGLAGHAGSLILAQAGDRIIGTAALELYGRAALLRSVAVDDEHRGRGLGQALTRAALQMGRERGVAGVYLLTETADGFFSRMGFRVIPRAQAEPAVGASLEFTQACPVSATCMMLDLEPAYAQTGEGGGER